VLPVMRKQRSGRIISISSSAGLSGFEFGTAYAASKFGLEGFMDSLHAEVAPFGITTTIVNPGFFRTELLTKQSTNYPSRSSRTTTSAERRCSSSGKPRMESNPVTPRSSRERSSPLRAKSHRRAAHRGRRCHWHRGAEGRRPEGADRGVPRPLDLAGVR